MKRLLLLFPLLILLASSHMYAGVNETLPTYHWAYDYIDQLRVRGYFQELFILNKPFLRGQIAQLLLTLEDKIRSGEITAKESDLWLIRRLCAEFQLEIEELKSADGSNAVKVGTLLLEDFIREHDKSKLRGAYRSKVGLSLLGNVQIYNGIDFDQNLRDDSLYVGKRWRGIVGFTEQAYARFRYRNFTFTLGRDFLRWGAGKTGTLMISDYSRPLDHFSLSFEYRFFKFSFMTSALDSRELADTLAVGSRSNIANRYLSAHRLDLKFFDRFYLGITEAILYGGPERNIELPYLNPFIFYHGVQMNDNASGNTLGSVDFAFYPRRNWAFFGELLIDDVQIEKTGSGDLEPNEIGMIFGLKMADPFNLNALNVHLEYIRVTNRTYNTPEPWEKFLHRRKPIGYFLGNDFDYWDFTVSKWLRKDFMVACGYKRIRRGEGRIEKEWDAPWMNYSVEEGYSEPFPTGTVEKMNAVKLEVIFQPSADWRFTLYAKYADTKNVANAPGINSNGWFIKAGIWFERDLTVKID